MWVGEDLCATTVVYGSLRRARGIQIYPPTMQVLDIQLGLSASIPPSSLLSNEGTGIVGHTSWPAGNCVGSEGQTWNLALTFAALSTVSLSPR